MEQYDIEPVAAFRPRDSFFQQISAGSLDQIFSLTLAEAQLSRSENRATAAFHLDKYHQLIFSGYQVNFLVSEPVTALEDFESLSSEIFRGSPLTVQAFTLTIGH
ncbi:MAG: hypothetical protein A2Z86_02860 [Candidatus Glassbacteria bacterium GWA2_58_10]|uniref:Uncharacterized protein n=1 Tax=Candidatus Glassbacteria bacterium GWA2_58_10 TaxID=1817865 RepID=A0A1F5YDX2_9BACT|nr:MAG: hypothetical protein A2Z86_02860 [Candidatus Glassbacteria bacterium GWA2_58_10]